MRVNSVLVTLLLLLVTLTPVILLEDVPQTDVESEFSQDVRSSSERAITYSVSPADGWTTGGEEITITGTGFLNMAYKNVTSDGEAYTWTTTTASYVTSSGWDPSIGVDSNGTVHIVYSNTDSDDFWHSSYDGSTWTHSKIRNCASCSNADLVIDSNDNVHIAYYHSISGTGYLLYSMYDGTSWTNNWSRSSVENDQISIALDANDRPHISYSRDGYICNAAMLSYHDGSSWTTVTLDDTTTYIGCDSSIAIDSNGFVHVAYRHHSNMDMLIASNISGSWQRYTVDNGNGVGYHSAMAVDSNDELHLVYASNAAGNTAYFADGTSGSAWAVSNQGNSRNTFSMYIDQFDIVHISEYNGNSNLGYSMVAPGGSRQSMTVDSIGNVGYESDIFVDDDNMVHIAYYDSSNKRLKYANRSTGMYLSQEITVQFGSYGSVTGTVVNDTTILVTTPVAGAVAEQVDLKLFGDQGATLDLGIAFQYVSPDDIDMDGVLNVNDDCPNEIGTSTVDLIGCPDSDNDGYSNAGDAFPNNPTEWMDSDGDGVGDNTDIFPNDANETMDSDGDGVGNNGDAFPFDANETMDSDGDGVGDNTDVFPLNFFEYMDSDGDGAGDNADAFPFDANETMDSDGDGVGDNADAFPNDASETMDSDGDGIGDNADQYPLLDNFLDTDGDTFVDLQDAFPNDMTQWRDTDGDGYGDNPDGASPDLFVNVPSQWSDLDGDGYGDNWGNASWNQTRISMGIGEYVQGAVLADYCPEANGNSSASGFLGCVDDDGDGIPNMFEVEEVVEVDTDDDGVLDEDDMCPNSLPGVVVNSLGCEVSAEPDPQAQTQSDGFMSGDIAQTVGMGAILLAIFSLLQTNMVASLLPDTFRWVQVLRRNSKLSKEEENELTYLQSVVQAYFSNPEELNQELLDLKADLTARYTNNQIKDDTRVKLFRIIDELMKTNPDELEHIAHNDVYFGLSDALGTDERMALLNEKVAMDQTSSDPFEEEGIAVDTVPSDDVKGDVSEDGYEYLELPSGSGNWFIRNRVSGSWERWTQ